MTKKIIFIILISSNLFYAGSLKIKNIGKEDINYWLQLKFKGENIAPIYTHDVIKKGKELNLSTYVNDLNYNEILFSLGRHKPDINKSTTRSIDQRSIKIKNSTKEKNKYIYKISFRVPEGPIPTPSPSIPEPLTGNIEKNGILNLNNFIEKYDDLIISLEKK